MNCQLHYKMTDISIWLCAMDIKTHISEGTDFPMGVWNNRSTAIPGVQNTVAIGSNHDFSAADISMNDSSINPCVFHACNERSASVLYI